MMIAIHPDDYTAPGDPPESDSASSRWARFLRAAGHEVRWVDVRRADIIDQLKGCHGFMWRWIHAGGMGRIARRLLPVLENELNMPVYPDQPTCWHYDDKIAQAYLFAASGIPSPRTWIWFDKDQAMEWAEKASFPLVLKLATGAGSSNVKLVKDITEARQWINRLFSRFHTTLHRPEPVWKHLARIARDTLLRNGASGPLDINTEPQGGYVYFQEFLEDNHFDVRVTVIGNRAFAFRRFNREGDFRASGSGRLDYDSAGVEENMIRLAFMTAKKLAMQSCAIDGLYRAKTPLVGEVSYTYVSSAVYECPGHWTLDGTPETGELSWNLGQMWPEEAQIHDFLKRVRNEE